jgi:hypothetical protein
MTRGIVLDVVKCPSCGGDHLVLFVPIKDGPRRVGGQEWTHWGFCLDTSDPVFAVFINGCDGTDGTIAFWRFA